ncbi:hypothetical protein [Sulfitobacter sp. BSw21498]|uniref:hypothetical protein n=1 Tax=Sulfitobacter sp. BSw21498 TaxID=664426 RepID=UPI00111013D7|nr:hypothetical protein [Sulfitobacter sp. BSw21498]
MPFSVSALITALAVLGATPRMTAISPWPNMAAGQNCTQELSDYRAEVLLSGISREPVGHNSNIQKFVHKFYLVETHLEKPAGEPHERSKR